MHLVHGLHSKTRFTPWLHALAPFGGNREIEARRAGDLG